MTAPTPPPAKKKPWYKIWWIWVIIIVLLGSIGSLAGGGEEADNEAASTTTAQAVAGDKFTSCREVQDAGLAQIDDTHPQWNPALDADGDGVGCETMPTEQAEAEMITAEEPETALSATPAIPATSGLEAQCVPNDMLAQMVGGVLTDSTQTVGNGQVIEDGSDTWIGVTIFRADGSMESRSDVWLLRDGGLYSVSGGARNTSWAVKAPNDAHMGLDIAQAVDSCVVQASIS